VDGPSSAMAAGAALETVSPISGCKGDFGALYKLRPPFQDRMPLFSSQKAGARICPGRKTSLLVAAGKICLPTAAEMGLLCGDEEEGEKVAPPPVTACPVARSFKKGHAVRSSGHHDRSPVSFFMRATSELPPQALTRKAFKGPSKLKSL